MRSGRTRTHRPHSHDLIHTRDRLTRSPHDSVRNHLSCMGVHASVCYVAQPTPPPPPRESIIPRTARHGVCEMAWARGRVRGGAGSHRAHVTPPLMLHMSDDGEPPSPPAATHALSAPDGAHSLTLPMGSHRRTRIVSPCACNASSVGSPHASGRRKRRAFIDDDCVPSR